MMKFKETAKKSAVELGNLMGLNFGKDDYSVTEQVKPTNFLITERESTLLDYGLKQD